MAEEGEVDGVDFAVFGMDGGELDSVIASLVDRGREADPQAERAAAAEAA
ncbi:MULTISPECIES: hypothetical protein [unclassified Streptomyces]|nr:MULTISPECIES: hypothetical protein [unclassified Streptomyces]MYS23984.1 hypothetical protein [Streptomyces sp. SID4948]